MVWYLQGDQSGWLKTPVYLVRGFPAADEPPLPRQDSELSQREVLTDQMGDSVPNSKQLFNLK